MARAPMSTHSRLCYICYTLSNCSCHTHLASCATCVLPHTSGLMCVARALSYTWQAVLHMLYIIQLFLSHTHIRLCYMRLATHIRLHVWQERPLPDVCGKGAELHMQQAVLHVCERVCVNICSTTCVATHMCSDTHV